MLTGAGGGRALKVCGLTVLFLTVSRYAQAHVKWFSSFDWNTSPRSVEEVLNPVFWGMVALTVVTLCVLVGLDAWAEKSRLMKPVCEWFSAQSSWSLLVVRVATFATLIVAWQSGTLLTPDLVVNNVWVERLQFAVLILLLFPRTSALSGAGLTALWAFGVAEFGLFHMLDYVNVLGVAYFLFARSPRRSVAKVGASSRSEEPGSGFGYDSALPVLYLSVGFSLVWLACEKLIYPQWALYLLKQNPVLTLGLDSEFFLVGAAFVEMSLGYLLIICLFSRSLSVTITLVFFLTTSVFGKVEVIGHTLIHASLIVFLFEGPGAFRPPAFFHRRLVPRMAFASVNFVVVLFALLSVYAASSAVFAARNAPHDHPKFEIAAGANAPTLKVEASPDSKSGWNIQLVTSNFRFAPESVGGAAVEGEGHAHLYLDGQKVARVYSNWFHLANVPSEKCVVRVTLNANDHSDFAVNSKVIEASVELSNTR